MTLPRLIQVGDTIMMFGGKDSISPITVTPGLVFHHRFGSFHHDDLIAKPYGSKVQARKTKGWLYALAPTPELWTAGALPHSTQIIFTLDISIICLYLELKPGHIVIEAGTGSGSASMGIVRAIAPNGHLFTFEFHQQRATNAKDLFARSGMAMDGLVTVAVRDVCQDGFGLESSIADAVLIDLPSPWKVVSHVHSVLKPNGLLCTFSPCIEQVQNTHSLLRSTGFTDITMMECLARPFEVLKRDHGLQRSNFHDQEDGLEKDDTDIKDAHEGESLCTNPQGKKQKNKRKFFDTNQSKHSTTKILLTRPKVEIRGHTSYLSFARKMPSIKT